MQAVSRLGIVAVALLCLSAVGCEKDPVNPEVPKFLKHADGTTYVHAADGCDYDLKDNGTFVKDEKTCPAK
jgi:hypothetical protein